MVDLKNFRVGHLEVIILAVVIIGLMACSFPQSGRTQLWADVVEDGAAGCIEDVSLISELATVGGAGDESSDTAMRVDSLTEPDPEVWVIQRCTTLWGDDARLVETARHVDMRTVS